MSLVARKSSMWKSETAARNWLGGNCSMCWIRALKSCRERGVTYYIERIIKWSNNIINILYMKDVYYKTQNVMKNKATNQL